MCDTACNLNSTAEQGLKVVRTGRSARQKLGMTSADEKRLYAFEEFASGLQAKTRGGLESPEALADFRDLVNFCVNCGDVLLRLNGLEILSKVAAIDGNSTAFTNSGILAVFCDMLSKLDLSNDEQRMIVPIILKTIACLCEHNFDAFMTSTQEDGLLRVISELFLRVSPESDAFSDSQDVRLLCDALVRWVGAICHGVSGLSLVVDQWHQSTPSLAEVFVTSVWPHASGDISVTCLETLSCILELTEPTLKRKEFWTRMNAALPKSIETPENAVLLDLLIKRARSSIEACSVAAYSCLVNLTRHRWGLLIYAEQFSSRAEHFASHAEWLLARSTSRSSVEAQWRYALFQALGQRAREPVKGNTLFPKDSPILEQIEAYVRDGVFTRRGPIEVATSGAR